MGETDPPNAITQGSATYGKADQSPAARRSESRTDQRTDEPVASQGETADQSEAAYGQADGSHAGYGSSGQGQYGRGGFFQGGYGQSGYGGDYGQRDPTRTDAADAKPKA